MEALTIDEIISAKKNFLNIYKNSHIKYGYFLTKKRGC